MDDANVYAGCLCVYRAYNVCMKVGWCVRISAGHMNVCVCRIIECIYDCSVCIFISKQCVCFFAVCIYIVRYVCIYISKQGVCVFAEYIYIYIYVSCVAVYMYL